MEIRIHAKIIDDVRRINPFYREIRQTIDQLDNSVDPLPNFRIVMDDSIPNGHDRQYNSPSCHEVAAIICGPEESTEPIERRRIIIYLRSGNLQNVPTTHSSYDSLSYVSTHMSGDRGYTFDIPKIDRFTGLEIPHKKVTCMDYYSYRGQCRDDKDSILIQNDALLHGGSLMQQYWVDQWLKIEGERLLWIKTRLKPTNTRD